SICTRTKKSEVNKKQLQNQLLLYILELLYVYILILLLLISSAIASLPNFNICSSEITLGS
ncbi:hypothetical protein COL91_28895, partial [Bacillus pseudomycoides]